MSTDVVNGIHIQIGVVGRRIETKLASQCLTNLFFASVEIREPCATSFFQDLVKRFSQFL